MTRNPGLNNRTDNSIMNDDLSISKICYTTQKMNISFFFKFFMFTLLFLLLQCLFNSTCKKLDYNNSLITTLDLSMKRLLSEHNCNQKKSESKLNLLEEGEKQCEDEKEKEDKEKSSRSLLLSRAEQQLEATVIELPRVNSTNEVSESRCRTLSIRIFNIFLFIYLMMPFVLSALVTGKNFSQYLAVDSYFTKIGDESLIKLFLMYISTSIPIVIYLLKYR